MTASDLCAARQMISCQAGRGHPHMKRREFITLIGQHHLAPEVRIALERHVGRGDWR
jgi:hypothetical protein